MWLDKFFLIFSVTIFCCFANHNRWARKWKWGVEDVIPGDRFLKVHFFNLTNPEDFLEGELPFVEDIGPYTYRQHKVKGGIKNNGESVEYNETDTYFFERKLSVGSPEDQINTANVPLIALIDLVMYNGAFLAPIISEYLTNYGEDLILSNLKVREYLFDGFDVSTYYTNGIIQSFLPDDFEEEKFGVFKGINGSNNGIFKVDSTKENFGDVIRWDGKSALGIWENNSQCDKIVGTDGNTFSSALSPSTVLKIFDMNACRSFTLVYKETLLVKGIQVYRFVYPVDMLQDARYNSDNECYCKFENISNCEHSGTTDLSLCRNGPYYLTFPHFMDADPIYIANVNGMHPNSEDMYGTYYDIEPLTGVVLQSRKRFQLNIKLRQYSEIPSFSDIREMLFPLFWTEESYTLDEDSILELRDFLYNDIDSTVTQSNSRSSFTRKPITTTSITTHRKSTTITANSTPAARNTTKDTVRGMQTMRQPSPATSSRDKILSRSRTGAAKTTTTSTQVPPTAEETTTISSIRNKSTTQFENITFTSTTPVPKSSSIVTARLANENTTTLSQTQTTIGMSANLGNYKTITRAAGSELIPSILTITCVSIIFGLQ